MMFDRIRILFAEQTTADEVVIFLIIVVVLALLFAFALYSAVLAVLWRTRLRRMTTLRALLFPNRAQLSKYLGEYLLAGSTSLLLTLTVAARHDAVQYVLEYPLYEVEGEQLRQAFPFGEVTLAELAPDAPDPGADGLATSLAELTGRPAGDREPHGIPSISVETLLLPSVRAGGADNASLWLRGLVDEMGPGRLERFPTERHLLTFAVFLLIAYVGWFAYGRSRAVAKSKGAGDTDHLRVLGRLLVPAVCVALLLVSAASAADPGRISRSAAAVAGLGIGLDAEEMRAASYFGGAMDLQLARGRLIRYLVEGGDSVPGPLGAIERLDADLAGVRDAAAGLARVDSAALSSLDALRTALGALDARLVRDSAASLGERMMLSQRADRVEAGLSGIGDEVAAAVGLSRDAAARAAATADSLALLQRRLAASETLARQLEADLRRLATLVPDGGLLLVVTTPATAYQVRSGNAQGNVLATGEGVGLHALPAGGYIITSGVGNGRASLAVGGAETVRVTRAPVLQ